MPSSPWACASRRRRFFLPFDPLFAFAIRDLLRSQFLPLAGTISRPPAPVLARRFQRRGHGRRAGSPGRPASPRAPRAASARGASITSSPRARMWSIASCSGRAEKPSVGEFVERRRSAGGADVEVSAEDDGRVARPLDRRSRGRDATSSAAFRRPCSRGGWLRTTPGRAGSAAARGARDGRAPPARLDPRFARRAADADEREVGPALVRGDQVGFGRASSRAEPARELREVSSTCASAPRAAPSVRRPSRRAFLEERHVPLGPGQHARELRAGDRG